MRVRRLDSGKLGKIVKTAQGGIRVPAYVTRTGVFRYVNPDGSERLEYRSPEEVFSETHLTSIAGAPITLDHPTQRQVTSNTWKTLAVGHAGEQVQRSDSMVEANLYIQDSKAVQMATSGERSEISLGYDLDYIAEPGVTPEGERYDGRQTNLVCNHIALVARGRAGRDVGLRLDSEGNQMGCATVETVLINIAGKDYEAGSADALKAIADLESKSRRVDSLERAAVEHLRARVKTFGVETRADSDMSTIMMETLKKLAPDVVFEGMSEEWLAGAFAVALSMALGLKSEPEPVAESPAPSAEGAASVRADVLDARNKKIELAAPAIPRDVAARQKMIDAGRRMRLVGEK